MLYQLIAFCLKACVHIFYKVRYVGPPIDDTHASVIVANHPNGLLDPLLVLTLTRTPIRFLAKEPLFRMPVVGTLLRIAKALPVYRKQDGYQGSDNTSMFRSVEQALQNHHCICLFPEGISHNEPQLQPLKTGAARIALAAEAQSDFQLQTKIIPVGLFFKNKGRFRSEAVITVGEAIILDESWKDPYQKDSFASARQLTQQIDEAIRQLTVNIQSWSSLPLLEFINALYPTESSSLRTPIERLGIISHTYESFMRTAPQEVNQLRARILRFKRLLHKLEIATDALKASPKVSTLLIMFMQQVLAWCIGLPIALIGILLFAVPYYSIDFLARKKAKEEDIIATVKVMGGIIFYPLWSFMLILCISYYGTYNIALLAVVLLPLIALYTLFFIENRTEAYMRFKVMYQSLSLKSSQQADALTQEKEEICHAIDQLLAQYDWLETTRPQQQS